MFNFTSDTLITSGVVNKYIIDNKFHYVYQLNLPLDTGNYYNKTVGDYNVLLGNTSEDMQKVGKLIRSGDGFYVFEYVSKYFNNN